MLFLAPCAAHAAAHMAACLCTVQHAHTNHTAAVRTRDSDVQVQATLRMQYIQEFYQARGRLPVLAFPQCMACGCSGHASQSQRLRSNCVSVVAQLSPLPSPPQIILSYISLKNLSIVMTDCARPLLQDLHHKPWLKPQQQRSKVPQPLHG
jgi:hypothetical protein